MNTATHPDLLSAEGVCKGLNTLRTKARAAAEGPLPCKTAARAALTRIEEACQRHTAAFKRASKLQAGVETAGETLAKAEIAWKSANAAEVAGTDDPKKALENHAAVVIAMAAWRMAQQGPERLQVEISQALAIAEDRTLQLRYANALRAATAVRNTLERRIAPNGEGPLGSYRVDIDGIVASTTSPLDRELLAVALSEIFETIVDDELPLGSIPNEPGLLPLRKKAEKHERFIAAVARIFPAETSGARAGASP